MNVERRNKNLLVEISVFLLCTICATVAGAQSSTRRLTMTQTIMLAQEKSISSMVNENIFASAYWQYRSYKAGRLPSLNLSAGLADVERTITTVADPVTGNYRYPYVFRLSNDLGLSLRQNISATGGVLSLSTNLRRYDQFDPRLTTYISRPITLSYMQPLFGFNSYKWDKKIEPHQFEKAKLDYLENMESVTIEAVDRFWGLAMAELNRDIAVARYENSKRLRHIAEERYRIGAIPRSEVLQMELTNLRDSIAINDAGIRYISQKNSFASFIGLREDADIELEIDSGLPGITLDYQTVLANAVENSSFEPGRRIEILQAERSIAQAKANRGINVQFDASFGLEQSGDTFRKAYYDPRDQEVAGFSIQIPILDWGVGRGKVKMAQSTAERIRYQQEQAKIDYEQNIFVRVMEFNAKQTQCEVSRRAESIADERYTLSVDNFTRGTLSVTELNTAREDKDNAQVAYISNLSDYWNSYFNLRKISLYDYLSGTDIGAAFDDVKFNELVE